MKGVAKISAVLHASTLIRKKQVIRTNEHEGAFLELKE